MARADKKLTSWVGGAGVFDIIEYTRVYLALGDTLWAFALALLLGIPFRIPSGVIIFLTVFGVYALNNRTDFEEDELSLSERSWIRNHTWTRLGSLSLVSASIVAFVYRPSTALAILWTVFWFGIYSVRIFPESFRYQRLKEVPIGKNLTIAFGGSGLFFLLLVELRAELTAVIVVLFLFVAMRFIIGSLIPDIRDIEGDASAGVATVPVVIGVPQTKRLLVLLNSGVTLLFYGAIVVGLLPHAAIFPGVINFVSFALIGVVTKENAQIVAILSDVNDTYVFFLLAMFSSNLGL